MSTRARFLFGCLLLGSAAVRAQVPRACSVTTSPTATVRSLGVAEIVSDLVIACNGQLIAPGTALAPVNVTVTLSAASGNRVFVGGYTDAVLLLAEPNESAQYPCTADVCAGTAGAAYGNGPLENRNVFAGRLTGANSISWTVSLDGGPQTMRVVNLRVNASTLAGQGPNLAAPAVGAAVAVSAATVTNPNVTVAALNPGLDFAVRSTDNNNVTVRLNNNAVTNSPVGADADFQFFLRFIETTPYTFRNRSVAATAADPTRVQTQARPGQSTEPRFLLSETGYYNQAFPALNGLSAAGLGDSGTRIFTRFANIPAGARLYVSTSPLADFTSGATARLVTTDVNGVGFYSTATPTAFVRGGTVGVAEIPVSAGQAIAVWEVLDPSVEVDRLNFGAFLSWNVPVADATVVVQGMLGPISPTGAVSTGPRFAVLNTQVNAAVIGAGGSGGVITPPGGGGGGSFAIVAPDALPAATAGQSYPPFTLGTNPQTAGSVWTVIEGTFPPGMTFGSNGVIAGTPLFPGAYAFTVRVQNVFGQTATARVAIVVRTSQLQVASVGIVNGTVGTALAPVTLSASGGTAPLRWFAPNERIPPGLIISETGIISGIPSVEGLYSLPVFVQDATGTTTQVTATFSISGFLRIVTTSPLATVQPAPSFYRRQLEAAGGTTPYQWSIAAGALPLGLSLDSQGVLSGTAPVPARGAFVVQVTDGAGRTARRSFTVELAGVGSGLDHVRVQPEGLRMVGAHPQLLRLSSSSAQPTVVEISVSTGDGGNWLSVDRSSLAVSADALGLVTVRASGDLLMPGSYQGFVMLRTGESARSIPVTLTAAPQMQVAPAALKFEAGQGSVAPPRQQVLVVNSSGREVWSWNARTTVPWLSVSATSGLAGTAFSVGANPAGLAPGSYWGEVTVTGATTGLSTVHTVTVALNVTAAGVVPPVAFSSGGVLALPSGTVAPLSVTNAYQSPFSYFVSRDFGDAFQWFMVAPATAILEPGVAQALALDVRPAVAPGVRRGVLSVAFAGAPLQHVEMASVQPVAEGCRATQLVTVLGAPAIDELLAVGQPVPVEAFVADDCGQRLLIGAVALLTPDGGVPLQHAGGGRWVGTWKPSRGASAGPLTLTLAARSAGLDGASDRTVNIAESTLPTVASVVTGGTFSAYRAVAPTSFVTLLGSGFTDISGSTPTVTLGGQPVQTVFVSANQINALLPTELPTPQVYSLVVRRGAQISVPEPVSVAAVAPDVFVIPQAGGRMQGAVTDPQFRLVDLANPVAAGEVIVVFCTGLGVSSVATVTVVGVPAQVIGVAPSPGFPGLYQVAARLGAATPAFADALVVVSSGGLSSVPVQIATRR